MSPETPGSRDNLPPKPRNNGGNGDDRPNGGYPPKGYDKTKHLLSAQEAKVTATENPDGKLEEELALADILPWVTEKLPDCKPHELAAKCCLNMQQEEHDDGDPEYKITDEDPADIKPDVERFITENTNAEMIAENEEVIASRKTEKKSLTAKAEIQEKKIPKQETKLAQVEEKTPKLRADVANREKTAVAETIGKAKDLKKNGEVKEDYATIKQLQAKFESLRSGNGGTIGALKTLLGPDGVKTPEMKAIVQRVLSTANALVTALPGKSDVVSRILDRSNINLGAKSPVQIFAGFLAEADKSDELTDDEKAQIRKVLHKQIDIKSGSDMKKALEQGRGVKTVTDKDGNTHTEHIPYDRENMAEIQPGQYLYTDKQGKSIMRVEIDSGKNYEFILPENSEADMGKVGIIGQVMDNMADYNMANPIYQRGITLQAGGRVELDFPRDWVTTQNVLKIFFDKTTGWDGGLLTEQDTEMMKHLMQGNAAKGDATRADADDATAKRDFTKQGILDENGEVNWERFKEVVDHNREQLGRGQIEFESGVETK